MRAIKLVFLGLLLASLALVAVLAAGSHASGSANRGPWHAAGAAGPLLLYLAAVALSNRAIPSQPSYLAGAFAGGAAGCIQLVHMSLEAFGSHLGDRPPITLAFMGAAFAVWLVAGIRAGLLHRQFRASVVVSVWSAACTMMVAVTYGLVLSACGFPDPAYVATWPEFPQSGWSDAASFAVANSFDAVFSNLLAGPLIGLLIGVVAGTIVAACRAVTNRQQAPLHSR